MLSTLRPSEDDYHSLEESLARRLEARRRREGLPPMTVLSEAPAAVAANDGSGGGGCDAATTTTAMAEHQRQQLPIDSCHDCDAEISPSHHDYHEDDDGGAVASSPMLEEEEGGPAGTDVPLASVDSFASCCSSVAMMDDNDDGNAAQSRMQASSVSGHDNNGQDSLPSPVTNLNDSNDEDSKIPTTTPCTSSDGTCTSRATCNPEGGNTTQTDGTATGSGKTKGHKHRRGSWLSIFQCGSRKQKHHQLATTTSSSSSESFDSEDMQDTAAAPPQPATEEEVAEITGEAALVQPPPSKRQRSHDDDANANRGMKNLGNTCYLNSAVQMLVGMDDFVRDLERYDEEVDRLVGEEEESEMRADDEEPITITTDCDMEVEEEEEKTEVAVPSLQPELEAEEKKTTEEEDSLPPLEPPQPQETPNNSPQQKKKPSLRKALIHLARSLHLPDGAPPPTGEEEGTVAVDPTQFKSTMDELSCLFEGYRQQDAHEFLSTVLDLLQDEILEEEKQRRRREEGGDGEEDGASASDARVEGGVGEGSEGEGTDSPPSSPGSLLGGSASSADTGMESTTPDGRPELKRTRMHSFSQLDTDDISTLLHETSTMDEEAAGVPVPVSPAGAAPTVKKDCASSGVRIPSSSPLLTSPRPPLLLLGGRRTPLATPGLFMSQWKATADTTPVGKFDISTVRATTHGEAAAVVEEEEVVVEDALMVAVSEPEERPSISEEDLTVENTTPSFSVAEPVGEGMGMDQEESVPSVTASSTSCEEATAAEAADDTQASYICCTQPPPPLNLTSPVDKHFGAQVEVRLVCDSCSYTRSKTEHYRYFSLDIATSASERSGEDNSNPAATVAEGLRSFFHPEKVELKCEKCFCENATEYKEIVRLPNALLLHFKRFIVDFSPVTGVTFRKDKSRVEFGHEVDLTPYVHATAMCDDAAGAAPIAPPQEEEEDDDESSTSNDGEEVGNHPMTELYVPKGRYSLTSIVHHHGSSASCGHYTADGARLVPYEAAEAEAEAASPEEEDDGGCSCNNDKKWLHFNDESVTEVMVSQEEDDSSSVLLGPTAQSTAYMVMYELAKI